MTNSTRLLMLGASALLLAPPLVDATAGTIYWVDSGLHNLVTAEADGFHQQTLLSSGLDAPVRLAVDGVGAHIYWIDQGLGEIHRCALSGASPQLLLAGFSVLSGLAVDGQAGRLYWSDAGNHTLQRANLDGSAVETLVSGGIVPYSITLDVAAGKLYWTEGEVGKIERANLDGSGRETVVTGLVSPDDVAVDNCAGKLYWSDPGAHRIQRANLDGTGLQDLAVNLANPEGIDLNVQGGLLFWSESAGARIGRMNLDGSGQEYIATGLGQPRDVAGSVCPGTTVAMSPNGGQLWLTGFHRDIIWSPCPCLGARVRLQISRTGATGPWSDIVANTPNDGLESWVVSGPPAEACFVRVVDVVSSAVLSVSQAAFEIADSQITAITHGSIDALQTFYSGGFVAWSYSGTFVTTAAATELSRQIGPSTFQYATTYTLHARSEGTAHWHSYHPGGLPADSGYAAVSINGGPGDPFPYFDASTYCCVGLALDGLSPAYSLAFRVPEYTRRADHFRMRLFAFDDAELPDHANVTLEWGPVSDARAADESPASLLSFSPNPFMTLTRISFTLPEPERASVQIFDVNGRLVRILLGAERQAGAQTLEWDGTDATGRRVGGGLYLVMLQLGGRHEVRKLIHLR